ncbi:MAG: TetR/AcrR family transcriptional regulator [Nocardioides sp.]|nr:TetR/AcrR family transcriptional regulator [Nocardioides sp.]
MSTSLTLNTRQAETVDRLLSAGLEVLRETGHEALTIRMVAHRAQVSTATAYTYLDSKQHLFAELFWRHLRAQPEETYEGDVVARVQDAIRTMGYWIAKESELAAAVTPALLANEPSVERLRMLIGEEFLRRFEAALGASDPLVEEALVLVLAGGLLQAGMKMVTYDELGDRLAAAVEVVLRGVVR